MHPRREFPRNVFRAIVDDIHKARAVAVTRKPRDAACFSYTNDTWIVMLYLLQATVRV